MKTLYRHRTFRQSLKHTVSDFFYYNMKEILLTSFCAAVIGGVTWVSAPAKGAVEFLPMKHGTVTVVPAIIDRPFDPTKLGSYTTTVDLHYITSDGTHSHIGAPYGALIGIHASKGIPASIPMSNRVNWAQTLKMQWDHKLNIPNVSGATRKWADSIVAHYANSTRDTKGIKTFIKEIDTSAQQMHKTVNYGGICAKMRIENCTAYYQTMGRVGGANIAAYGMTEIFPSHDGQLNYLMLDTLLRNAGENYINVIPSQGDTLLSMGLFQFTSLAIRRDESGLLGGASIIDDFAGKKLPGSVVRLTPSQAHKAAWELGAYNIGMLMRNLNHVEAERLATHCPIDKVTSYLALAHHSPVKAVRAGMSWIKAGCNKPLVKYVSGRDMTEYAIKTTNNYEAIIAHLK